MKIIVGLGNPGSEYQETRHNVGFMVIEELISTFGGNLSNSKKLDAHTTPTQINGGRVLLAMPTTFMNLSGDSVRKILKFYNVPPKELCVIHDDIHINLGEVRLGPRQPPKGHNGVRHINKCIGDENYYRIRCGLGPIPDRANLQTYVVQKFTPEERPGLREVLRSAHDAAVKFATQ